MSEAVEALPEETPRKKGFLIPIVATALLGGAGFASTYMGVWSPAALISKSVDDHGADSVPTAVFVDVPRFQMTIPGGRGRSLVLSASIETDTEFHAEVEHLMPRVSDAFNSFLSGIDPAAYDKRGVLEIIRAELVTRTRYVLGEKPVKDLLITEFLIK
ncbi:flagellar basal body-associated FliL family protein [Paracoccus salsus]|uniref:flagellar basal body-associated FliL family protein n=1 Tax=Paracoccus salsus TaxID=2911061 RepID=UPI001F40A5FD|nr:flagellar basal body-associated FliL family protein [Paracoccus salsus]MCF3972685.1 flagellar basal body-associated FliL family protein [Paracoccus salsus]